MKKTATAFFSILISALLIHNALAFNIPNRIYADTITAESGERVTIPIKIQNNNCFMGFAVIITYDENVFTPVSVSKGSILSGMFNDSISTSTDNSFKVVYTGTSNIIADGTMFNIVFDVADGISGKYKINLSYSQQDTFNESWDNVVFACEDVDVIITENGTTAATESATIITTEATTQNHEITTQATTSVSSTTKPEAADPDAEETTTVPVTEPSTEPVDEPDEGKPLSVRINEWIDGLPFPLNIILGIFVIPVAFFASLFE